ncbi:MAG: 3-keto-5-aminohexanoate cleavage protein [Phycisphaeraceae bacterium]|jgi:3-keto-5-aminohexanoate cleavage enzyme|nr:3-keto-5-aminohexanoate cleavage protein [Phycisphaeraceae bacterium]
MNWDPLVITVTCDPRLQDPLNPRCDELTTVDTIAREYIDSNEAAAAVDHIHGLYSRDTVIQPDGRLLQIPDIKATAEIVRNIRDVHPDTVIQQGLASMRPEQKLSLWEAIRPEMSSLNMNSHDEYFDPYPNEVQPVACYSVHPINELRQYFQWSRQHGVKPELECFDTGAFDAIRIIRDGIFWTDEGIKEDELGLLDDPLWATFFFGWPGQSCQPMTDIALFNQIYHIPDQLNWSMSCMSRDPREYWAQINRGILQNGHVRVGYEDCGKHADGTYASSCADLVDTAVQMARIVGRPVATAQEARQIIGLN